MYLKGHQDGHENQEQWKEEEKYLENDHSFFFMHSLQKLECFKQRYDCIQVVYDHKNERKNLSDHPPIEIEWPICREKFWDWDSNLVHNQADTMDLGDFPIFRYLLYICKVG